MSELWWSMPEFLFRYRHQSLESILMITDTFFLSRYIRKKPKKSFRLYKTEWEKKATYEHTLDDVYSKYREIIKQTL